MTTSILLVEDQTLVRAGMRLLINAVRPDGVVDEIGTFEQAIAHLAGRGYDVVFLDVDLNGPRTGLDLLTHIRDHDLSCRVIMLSALDQPDLMVRCLEAGAAGFINKCSADEGEFARAVEAVFDHKVALPASMINPVRAGTDPVISPRLQEVLFHVCQGLPNKAIAKRMNISEGTVRKSYVAELLRAFGVCRRTELMIEVARRGWRLRPEATPPYAEPGGLSAGAAARR